MNCVLACGTNREIIIMADAAPMKPRTRRADERWIRFPQVVAPTKHIFNTKGKPKDTQWISKTAYAANELTNTDLPALPPGKT